MLPDNVDLYVGALIEEESERQVLLALLPILSERKEKTVVLANLHVGERQLDLVISSSNLTLLMEVKGGTNAITGRHNGVWTVKTRGGRVRPARNAYRQALDAANALADSMRAFDAASSGYPSACVTFTPSVPEQSDLPSSDFKVSLVGLEAMRAQLSKTSQLRWPAATWRRYASALRLIRVETIEGAFDEKLLTAYSALDRYTAAFAATYAPPAARHVADVYRFEGSSIGVAELHTAVLDYGADLLIGGPSGCGKSLLAQSLAIQLLRHGVVPVMVECKSFDGQLRTSLDREVKLLDMPSAAILLRTALTVSRPVALIVDGYNECNEAARLVLTRALRSASARYGAAIIVSSSIPIERADLLNLRSVEVSEPSTTLKLSIAGVDPGTESSISTLLDVVATGFEADLVGQVGRELALDSSRFAILDFFVRRKLAEQASDAIQVFCAVAERLIERVAFSLSVREFDRLLAEKTSLRPKIDDYLRHGIITVRGERVSFGHESFLNAFASEALVRNARGDPRQIQSTLVSARHTGLRVLLLGAIDDESLVLALLSTSKDSELLEACVRGECGAVARQFVNAELDAISSRLEKEAAQLKFDVTADGAWNVQFDESSLSEWSEHERAVLSVLAAELSQGRRAKPYLELLALLDARLDSEFRRLQPEAMEKQVGIRSSLFAITYVIGNRELGVVQPLVRLHNGDFLFRKRDAAVSLDCLLELWSAATSLGQIYFVLALSRRAWEFRGRFLSYVLPLLDLDRWRQFPYHVHLELLQFLHFLRDVPEELKPPLVDALEKLLPKLSPVFTGDIVEVLRRLGSLEHEERQMEESVEREIEDLVAEHSSDAKQAQAWSLYCAQFDHPFSTIICEVIEALPQEKRNTLYYMACLGVAEWRFFLGTLLDKLTESGDPRAASAIARWTELPAPLSSMPQDQTEAFVTAYLSLGRLRADLPTEARRLDRKSAQNTLTACGILYFWLEQLEPDQVLEVPDARAAMSWLVSEESNTSVGVLYEISRSYLDSKGRSIRLINSFPKQALSICRSALKKARLQSGYFEHQTYLPEETINTFAIQVMERFGTAIDLPLLRSLVSQPMVAEAALSAIKTIEGRAGSCDR